MSQIEKSTKLSIDALIDAAVNLTPDGERTVKRIEALDEKPVKVKVEIDKNAAQGALRKLQNQLNRAMRNQPLTMDLKSMTDEIDKAVVHYKKEVEDLFRNVSVFNDDTSMLKSKGLKNFLDSVNGRSADQLKGFKISVVRPIEDVLKQVESVVSSLEETNRKNQAALKIQDEQQKVDAVRGGKRTSVSQINTLNSLMQHLASREDELKGDKNKKLSQRYDDITRRFEKATATQKSFVESIQGLLESNKRTYAPRNGTGKNKSTIASELAAQQSQQQKPTTSNADHIAIMKMLEIFKDIYSGKYDSSSTKKSDTRDVRLPQLNSLIEQLKSIPEFNDSLAPYFLDLERYQKTMVEMLDDKKYNKTNASMINSAFDSVFTNIGKLIESRILAIGGTQSLVDDARTKSIADRTKQIGIPVEQTEGTYIQSSSKAIEEEQKAHESNEHAIKSETEAIKVESKAIKEKIRGRLEYLGEKEDKDTGVRYERTGVLTAPNDDRNTQLIEAFLDSIGRKYTSEYADDTHTQFFIEVDSKEDFRDLMELWKESKNGFSIDIKDSAQDIQVQTQAIEENTSAVEKNSKAKKKVGKIRLAINEDRDEDSQPSDNTVYLFTKQTEYGVQYMVDLQTECAKAETAVKRLFSVIDAEQFPALAGWMDGLLEEAQAQKNGFKGIEQYNGMYTGAYSYGVEFPDENSAYIWLNFLDVAKEKEEEYSAHIQSECEKRDAGLKKESELLMELRKKYEELKEHRKTSQDNIGEQDRVKKYEQEISYLEKEKQICEEILAIQGEISSIPAKYRDRSDSGVPFGMESVTDKKLASIVQSIELTSKFLSEEVQRRASASKSDIDSAQEMLERKKYSAEIQKQWIDYLTGILNDDKYKVSGKKEANDNLKLYRELLYQLSNGRKFGDQYPKERLQYGMYMAYKEAERVGVAKSKLDQYSGTHPAVNESLFQENRELFLRELEMHKSMLDRVNSEIQTITNNIQMLTAQIEESNRRETEQRIARESVAISTSDAQRDKETAALETAITQESRKRLDIEKQTTEEAQEQLSFFEGTQEQKPIKKKSSKRTSEEIKLLSDYIEPRINKHMVDALQRLVNKGTKNSDIGKLLKSQFGLTGGSGYGDIKYAGSTSNGIDIETSDGKKLSFTWTEAGKVAKQLIESGKLLQRDVSEMRDAAQQFITTWDLSKKAAIELRSILSNIKSSFDASDTVEVERQFGILLDLVQGTVKLSSTYTEQQQKAIDDISSIISRVRDGNNPSVGVGSYWADIMALSGGNVYDAQSKMVKLFGFGNYTKEAGKGTIGLDVLVEQLREMGYKGSGVGDDTVEVIERIYDLLNNPKQHSILDSFESIDDVMAQIKNSVKELIGIDDMHVSQPKQSSHLNTDEWTEIVGEQGSFIDEFEEILSIEQQITAESEKQKAIKEDIADTTKMSVRHMLDRAREIDDDIEERARLIQQAIETQDREATNSAIAKIGRAKNANTPLTDFTGIKTEEDLQNKLAEFIESFIGDTKLTLAKVIATSMSDAIVVLKNKESMKTYTQKYSIDTDSDSPTYGLPQYSGGKYEYNHEAMEKLQKKIDLDLPRLREKRARYEDIAKSLGMDLSGVFDFVVDDPRTEEELVAFKKSIELLQEKIAHQKDKIKSSKSLDKTTQMLLTFSNYPEEINNLIAQIQQSINDAGGVSDRKKLGQIVSQMMSAGRRATKKGATADDIAEAYSEYDALGKKFAIAIKTARIGVAKRKASGIASRDKKQFDYSQQDTLADINAAEQRINALGGKTNVDNLKQKLQEIKTIMAGISEQADIADQKIELRRAQKALPKLSSEISKVENAVRLDKIKQDKKDSMALSDTLAVGGLKGDFSKYEESIKRVLLMLNEVRTTDATEQIRSAGNELLSTLSKYKSGETSFDTIEAERKAYEGLFEAINKYSSISSKEIGNIKKEQSQSDELEKIAIKTQEATRYMSEMKTELDSFSGDTNGISEIRAEFEKLESVFNNLDATKNLKEQKDAMKAFEDAQKTFGTKYDNFVDAIPKSEESSFNINDTYNNLTMLIQRINMVNNEISKLQSKNGDGFYTGIIEKLKSGRSWLESELSVIIDDIREFTKETTMVGSISEPLFASSVVSDDNLEVISKFVGDIRTKAEISEKQVIKLSEALKNASEFDISNLEKFSGILENFKIADKKILDSGVSNISGDIQKQISSYRTVILNATKEFNEGNISWDSQEIGMLEQLIGEYSKYADAVSKAAAQEQKYFAGKQKYTDGMSSSSISAESEKVFSDTRKKLEDAAKNFAKNSGIDQIFTTGFSKSAEGISRLDFSVFDSATNSLRNFNIEMGEVTNGMFVTETTVSKSLSNINAAQKQLQTMSKLIVDLSSAGVNVDPETSTKSVAKVIEYVRLLQEELAKGDDADQSILSSITKDSKLAVSEIEKAYKQMQKMKDGIQSGSLSKVDKKIDTNGSVYSQAKEQIESYVQKIPNATVQIGAFNEQSGKIPFTINVANQEMRKCEAQISSLTGQMTIQEKSINQIRNSVSQASGAYEQFKTSVGSVAKQLATAMIGYNAFYKVLEMFRTGIGYVKEIDLAMTELRKVTDETDATYSKFLNNAYKSSGTIGATVSEFTEASSNFARLGYSIDQSADMAQTAIVYKNVAD